MTLTNADRDVVTDFTVASDSISIGGATISGAVITDGVSSAEYVVQAAADVVVADDVAVLELNFNFDTTVDLATSTDYLTDILSALGAGDNGGAGKTPGKLTLTNAGDQVLMIAYQGGDAYLFLATAGGAVDGEITAGGAGDSIVLVGTFENIALGAFTNADFIA